VWWRHFPKIESRPCVAPSPGDCPDPRFPVGAAVRLVGRPERVRRVLRAEWHWHRQQFVFVVETSAPLPFAPYWFAGQLVGEASDAEPGAAPS
jgi:hypothetical protein